MNIYVTKWCPECRHPKLSGMLDVSKKSGVDVVLHEFP